MGTCWACTPFCDRCKPKFYECPECGGQGNLFFKRCIACGRPMTPEDVEWAHENWRAKKAAENMDNQ